MIVATLHVYGFRDQKNWGDWTFLQLPAPNDIIAVKVYDGWHYVTVRHTEHQPMSISRSFGKPHAIVVTDWKEEFSTT